MTYASSNRNAPDPSLDAHDEADLAVLQEWADEPTVSYEVLIEEMKADGLL